MYRRAGFAFLLVLMVALTGVCNAQYAAQGFVFAAPGGRSPSGSSALHLGGGFDMFVNRGHFAIGGDLGYMAPMSHIGDGFGLLDLTGGYHFGLKDRRLTPFLSGGYSLGFREGHFNALNLGGGANFWMTRKMGLRMELRDVIHPETNTMEGFQYVNVRIGLTFR